MYLLSTEHLQQQMMSCATGRRAAIADKGTPWSCPELLAMISALLLLMSAWLLQQ